MAAMAFWCASVESPISSTVQLNSFDSFDSFDSADRRFDRGLLSFHRDSPDFGRNYSLCAVGLVTIPVVYSSIALSGWMSALVMPCLSRSTNLIDRSKGTLLPGTAHRTVSTFQLAVADTPTRPVVEWQTVHPFGPSARCTGRSSETRSSNRGKTRIAVIHDSRNLCALHYEFLVQFRPNRVGYERVGQAYTKYKAGTGLCVCVYGEWTAVMLPPYTVCQQTMIIIIVLVFRISRSQSPRFRTRALSGWIE